MNSSVGHRVMIFDIEVEVTDGFYDPKLDKYNQHHLFNDPLINEYFCYILDTKINLILKSRKTKKI